MLPSLWCTFCIKHTLFQYPHLIAEKLKSGKFPKWVATYNPANSVHRRMHLMKEHGATEVTSEEPKQRGLQEAFNRGQVVADEREARVALAVCFNPLMTFRLVEDPFFVQAFGLPCSRRTLPMAILNLKNGLVDEMKKLLKGAMVTVCLDGWTNQFSHRKVMNVFLVVEGFVVFWRTIPMRYGKSSAVLFDLLKTVVGEFESELGVHMVACVADNENSNREPWLSGLK